MEPATSSSHRINRGDLFTWTWTWQILLLALAYAASGAIGLQLAHYEEGATLIWPPAGLSLAALILFGRRLWPGIFIGTLLVGLGNPLMNWTASLGIAAGNALESVVAVTLLIRVADFRPNLERMQDAIAFLLIGVVGCPMINATTGVASYYITGLVDAASAGPIWLIWWLGNVGGVLILAPLLLMLVHGTGSWTRLALRVETWIVFGLLWATTLFAFFGPELGLLRFAACAYPIPLLVWAGTRLGPRGATLGSVLITLTGTIATASGSGPFALETTTEAVFLLWSWAVLVGIIAFTLAATVEQRDLAERRRRSEEGERLRTEKQKLLLLERERLTREMHDGLGGQIVSVLAMVERGLATPDEVAEGIRRAIDDMQIVTDSLNPTTADLPASLGKLRARLEPLLRRNGIALTWIVDDRLNADVLASEAVLHVLRIIQEAVTNTLRHANARSVKMEITLCEDDPRQLHLSVRDDGRGLPTDSTIGGRGIENMKARAEEFGAEIRIENTGSGTNVDLTTSRPH